MTENISKYIIWTEGRGSRTSPYSRSDATTHSCNNINFQHNTENNHHGVAAGYPRLSTANAPEFYAVDDGRPEPLERPGNKNSTDKCADLAER